MVENSDYENRKEREEIEDGFITISYLVLWPIYLVLLFTVDGFDEILPGWTFTVCFLFSPLVLAFFLNRWNNRLEGK